MSPLYRYSSNPISKLILVAYPVYIKVVKRNATVLVTVDDIESGTRNMFTYIKPLCHAFYKTVLPVPSSFERDDIARFHLSCRLFAKLNCIILVISNKFLHNYFSAVSFRYISRNTNISKNKNRFQRLKPEPNSKAYLFSIIIHYNTEKQKKQQAADITLQQNSSLCYTRIYTCETSMGNEFELKNTWLNRVYFLIRLPESSRIRPNIFIIISGTGIPSMIKF